MLNTAYEIMDEVLVRAGVTSTTTGLYTDTILRDWVAMAHRWGASRHKWPFTEGRVSTTYASSEENQYPEGWKPDSIRILTVGDKRFRKLNYLDYQQFREERPDDTARVFSDFGLTYFVNPNADVSGTTVLYGQYVPIDLDMTDSTATTIFSNRDEDGNEALVEEVLCYAKRREKKMDESAVHHQRAMELLDGIWKRITDEQYAYQTKDRGMFEYFDVLDGSFEDQFIRRDRFF